MSTLGFRSISRPKSTFCTLPPESFFTAILALGVLICGTGIGISLAANRVHGIRAAVCSESYSAELTRRHNDANMIAFGARVVGEGTACAILDAFFGAKFEGGRHAQRVAMLDEIRP